MKFCNRQIFGILLIGALAVCVPSVRAQEQQPPNEPETNNPSQPAQPLPPVENQNNDNNNGRREPAAAARGLFLGGDSDNGAAQPDSHILSGAETLGLASTGARQRFFDFSLHVGEDADTGIVQHRTESVTSFGGSINLDRSWSRYKMALSYSGGDYLYHPNSEFNAPYQTLSFSNSITFRRWVLHLRDDLTLSPQSSFGGLDTGALGVLMNTNTTAVGTVVPGIASNTETILTGRAQRLSNLGLIQADYSLTRRSAITLTGSYALLHFIDPGYIDSSYVNAQAGYNYLLSPKNTIAFTYTFNQTGFSKLPARIRNDLLQVVFGRKITGRWAFQAGAGPQLLNLEHFGFASGRSLSWSAFTSLAYGNARTGYTLAYSHGISGGSGVFLGAETDTVSLSAHRQITRSWTGLASVGYSRNRNLAPVGPSNLINYWFASASAARNLGRHFHLGFNYGFQQQDINSACPVLACGSVPRRHVGGISLDWHFAPNATAERY